MASFFERLKEKFSAKEELNEELISLDEYEEFVDRLTVKPRMARYCKHLRQSRPAAVG